MAEPAPGSPGAPGLTHLAQLEARGHWGIKCGLDNPRRLLEALGAPHLAFPVVLIAGTNGKGSTGAFLAQALRACGLKTGWTTSPHLLSPTERVWLDGAPVEAEQLDQCLGEALAAERRLGIQATYFELMIAAAFLAFRAANIQVALVEVGMGGRWDATNATDPILTVLTNVELDHLQYLGSDRAAIAREKLCTARHGRPLVLGPTLDPAWIWPLLECRPTLQPAPRVAAESLEWDRSKVAGHPIQLAGVHQLDNLGTALEALRALRRLGFAIPEALAWEGLERTTWPGRLWAVPGLRNVFMDGAHNLDGARTLAAHALATGVRPHLVFSAMGDKDLAGMAQALKAIRPASITLARGDNPRYATAQALRAAWGAELEVLELDAVAARLRQPCHELRLVCGSLYFIGDLLRALGITPRF